MIKALLAVIIAVLSLSACTEPKDHTQATQLFKVITFKSAAGWGYAVILKGRPFIRQPYMPAVSGNVPFKNEADALKVGDYVCSLIRTKQLPAVRTADLVKMGILMDSSAQVRPQEQIH